VPRGDPARVAASPRRARAIVLDKTTKRRDATDDDLGFMG